MDETTQKKGILFSKTNKSQTDFLSNVIVIYGITRVIKCLNISLLANGCKAHLKRQKRSNERKKERESKNVNVEHKP